MSKKINIIGAGHLGMTIGYLLAKNELVQIGAICNTSEKSSLAAMQFIGQGKYYALNELPAADITLITTPDDKINLVCEELCLGKSLKNENIIFHCSGSLTSDALALAKEKGCYVASIHPMRSFAKPEFAIEHFEGTYAAMEGDSEAIAVVKPLFDAIGSITYEISCEKKSLYHAAGVFASNYLVGLAHEAQNCLTGAGVEDNMAMKIITNIMQGTVSNLEKTLSPNKSLTGPIQRGDISTIKQHLETLGNKEQKELYASLGRSILSLTSHSETIKVAITEILNQKQS